MAKSNPSKPRKNPMPVYQVDPMDLAAALKKCQAILGSLNPDIRKIAGPALAEWCQVNQAKQQELPIGVVQRSIGE